MATTVGPAREKADNPADRSLIAQSVWLPVRRFHVGTSAKTLTQDAGYTTATDSCVDLPTASLFLRGRSPYTRALDRKAMSDPLVNLQEVESVQSDILHFLETY